MVDPNISDGLKPIHRYPAHNNAVEHVSDPSISESSWANSHRDPKHDNAVNHTSDANISDSSWAIHGDPTHNNAVKHMSNPSISDIWLFIGIQHMIVM